MKDKTGRCENLGPFKATIRFLNGRQKTEKLYWKIGKEKT